MRFQAAHLAAAAALALTCQAQAAIITITGTTAGKPTFNRPSADLSGISAIGSGVRYDAYTFSASLGGDYTFLTTGLFDTFSLLYTGVFNPAMPLAGAIKANDDLLSFPFTTSGFAQALTAGTIYTLVTTGYDSTEFGAYSVTIGGPGVITQVPEPATYALMGLGAAVVLLRQRRKAATTVV